MKCEKYRNSIDDLVEGELDAEAAGAVNLHIFACAECASQYETLKREKEFYAHYLFDVEPSADLSAKFRAGLNAEISRQTKIVEKPSAFDDWKTNLIGFLKSSPILASAVLLLIIGFGLSKFAPVETTENEALPAKTERANARPDTQIGEIDREETSASATKIADDKISDSLKNAKNPQADKFSYKQKNVRAVGKIDGKLAAAKIEIKKKIIPEYSKENSAAKNRLTEQQRRVLLANDLEKETFKQIEKIELLLRSFRNVRSIENTESFDVAYEKEQARKLLGKNARLRQNAETYGTFYTAQLLERAEPLLLEIANLDGDSSAEKVLEIKDRVKNQNIIASLQIYK